MWGDRMWGMGGFMGLGWIVILLAVGAVVWLLARGSLAGGGQTDRRSALDVLKERYARGEIGREEFEQKKARSRDIAPRRALDLNSTSRSTLRLCEDILQRLRSF